MDMKIVKEVDNPFFKRKDLIIEIDHKNEATPKIDDIKNTLVGRYNVDITQVVVDYVMSKTGMSKSTVKAKILNEKPPEKKAPKEEAKSE